MSSSTSLAGGEHRSVSPEAHKLPNTTQPYHTSYTHSKRERLPHAEAMGKHDDDDGDEKAAWASNKRLSGGGGKKMTTTTMATLCSTRWSRRSATTSSRKNSAKN